MDISPELQALFDRGKEIEATLPLCEKCGERTRFMHTIPGRECRPCGTRWGFDFATGKEHRIGNLTPPPYPPPWVIEPELKP